jgi:transposase
VSKHVPAKGKGKLSPHQSAVIAAGKATGKTHKQIASEAGVSESTVDHRVRRPETLALIARLEAKHEAALDAGYGEMVAELRKDLAHKDPEVRTRARDQLLRILAASAKAGALKDNVELSGRAAAGSGEFFLEELLYARHARMKTDGE